MRGWVAISVTATPAAAPRRIREVLRIIIREPSGLRLRPTTGLDRREPRPCGTPHIVRVGLHRPLGQRPIGLCRPLLRRARPRYHELPQINGYPFHPSEQDMISAADIKDQELPKTSIKPVYWNGTHPSVFEFRVEKERDHASMP